MHTPRNALSVSLASSLDSSPGGGAKLNWSRFYKLLTHTFVVTSVDPWLKNENFVLE